MVLSVHSISANSCVTVPSTVFPNTDYRVDYVDFDQQLGEEVVDYTLQFNNGTNWYDGYNGSTPFEVSYNNFTLHREHELRYRFITPENECYSNVFNAAYIDVNYYINDTDIHIHWTNHNFEGKNNLYLDYDYYNWTGSLHSFTELNLNQTHVINATSFVENLFIYNYTFVVSNPEHDLNSSFSLTYDELVSIATKQQHDGFSYCTERFCRQNPPPNITVCVGNRIYRSPCYALCNEDLTLGIERLLNYCNATSTPTSSPSTTPSTTPTSSPSTTPTSSPSTTPTSSPSTTPTSSPTSTPSSTATSSPTSSPSTTPTSTPSTTPTSTPSTTPTSTPSTNSLHHSINNNSSASLDYWIYIVIGVTVTIVVLIFVVLCNRKHVTPNVPQARHFDNPVYADVTAGNFEDISTNV